MDEQDCERICEATKSCVLTPLIYKIDEKIIQHSNFDDFRLILNDNLHLLLDMFHKFEDFLISAEKYDTRFDNFHQNLILVLCEQSTKNPFFQSDQQILVVALSKLLDRCFAKLVKHSGSQIFEVYKQQLKRDLWKYHLGAAYGFPTFIENLLKNEETKKLLDEDKILFTLSVGSLLSEHYDPIYQTLGLKIYLLLLKNCDRKVLLEFNIHQVIYDVVFKLIQKSKDMEFNHLVWDCIYHFMVLEEKSRVDLSKWSKFDDVMEALLPKIALESSISLSTLLLFKIIKFSGMNVPGGVKSEDEIGSFYDFKDSNLQEYFMGLRKQVQDNPNYQTQRWVKKLLTIYTAETSKLDEDSKSSFVHLNGLHLSYLLSIYCLDPSIFKDQLEDFIMKFTLLMTKVAKLHQNDEKMVNSTIYFLETFCEHLGKSDSHVLKSMLTNVLETAVVFQKI